LRYYLPPRELLPPELRELPLLLPPLLLPPPPDLLAPPVDGELDDLEGLE